MVQLFECKLLVLVSTIHDLFHEPFGSLDNGNRYGGGTQGHALDLHLVVFIDVTFTAAHECVVMFRSTGQSKDRESVLVLHGEAVKVFLDNPHVGRQLGQHVYDALTGNVGGGVPAWEWAENKTPAVLTQTRHL